MNWTGIKQNQIGCLCVYVQVGKGACMCAWMSEVNTVVFLNGSLAYFLRRGLLLNLELTDLTRLADQSAPGTPLPLLFTYFGTRGYKCTLLYVLFLCLLGI